MNSSLAKYQTGEANVLRVEVVLRREAYPNGYNLVHITPVETEEEIYTAWENLSNRPRDKPPKNTGGKKPYMMLMVQEIEKLRDQNIEGFYEVLGFLVGLSKHVEWETGRLIMGRKKVSMQYADLLKLYGGNNRGLDKTIKTMKKHDILYYSIDGYFISRRFAKKGAG